ncbi:MAG: UDP-N-acetylmuramate--alanine ligase [Gammaproteobacteria bacterium]|jgi:UDP-N-acetylmuramate--alanine ligase
MPEHRNTPVGNSTERGNAMGRVNHIHFVGIGGAGMSGIAEVLHNLGYQISGSDMHESRVTKHLCSLGIDINLNHDPAQINGCDVVVYSSAITDENCELIEARAKRIPVIPRAEMLAELMRLQQGIAVAGTHGKTTTTSLVASVLAEGGFDPTYVIGGLLNSSGSHARLGTGKYLVAEADESDASFLHLQPTIAILTNVDADHLETYGGDINCLQDNFIEFLHHLPFHGLAVICLDDEGVRNIMGNILKPFKTYGFDEEADYFAHDVRHEGQQSWFQVSRADCKEWLQVKLNLPGKHNILNALAAIAVAHEVGVADESIITALAEFQGIGRRCQVLGELDIQGKKILLIDDYAHHPREINATLQGVREGWPDKRIVVIFQPHRYTRTRDLFEDFCQVLSETDQLLLLDIYSAGEKPIAGADGRSLCRAIRLRGQVDPIFVEQREELSPLLENLIEENDLLLVLGAGDVGVVSTGLVQQYG